MGPMLAYNNFYKAKKPETNESEIPTGYIKKPCACTQAIHCVIDRQTVFCQHLHDAEIRTELKCTREGGYTYFERVVSETQTTEHRGFLDD